MSVLNRARRDTVGNNLSFLDVISAGFGAIVLLLVITKTAEPTRIVEEGRNIRDQLEAMGQALPAVSARVDRLRAMLGDRDSDLQALERRIGALAPRAAEARERAAEPSWTNAPPRRSQTASRTRARNSPRRCADCRSAMR